MQWESDLKAKRTTWRGTEFDSVLEADWACTLTMWGIEWAYHPGRVFLHNGDIYEPDFQLDCDMILEVKGAHDDRIDKAWRAAAETGIPVIIGRSSFLPAGSDLEMAGAVWEPVEYGVVSDGQRLCFREGVEDLDSASWSAHLAYARGLNGLRMFKAVGDRAV